jgi:hypothetical protein
VPRDRGSHGAVRLCLDALLLAQRGSRRASRGAISRRVGASRLSNPIVLLHARALLSSTPQGTCDYVEADLRDTAAIVRAAARTLDLGAPVALMLLIILHLIPDVDAPYEIVAELMSALPSGSYLVLAHPASDIRAAQMAEMTRRVNARMSGPVATMRDRAAITRFCDGLDLVEPGVVQPQQWRPQPGTLSPPQVTAWCGVARKR